MFVGGLQLSTNSNKNSPLFRAKFADDMRRI
jgi:hypothetical protein